jgi:hypothetical protein
MELAWLEDLAASILVARRRASRHLQVAETLHFAAAQALSLTFFPTWLRALEAREPLGASVRLVADKHSCQKFTIFGAAG